MKKIALLLAVLMVMGAATGFCGMSGTVDGFVENRMNSDIRPVEDAGKILDITNKGIDKTYHTVADPMEPGLKHVRKVRDETMSLSKKIVNKTWDILTLKDLRDRG